MAGSSDMRRTESGDATQAYLRRIAKIPLLTPAEEVHLGGIVRRWKQSASPTPEGVRSGRRALDRMVRGNLRLVVSVCKHQLRAAAGVELMDLIQGGNLGLIRAVELFDPSRGYRFSTYGYWWIRQAVRRAQAEQSQMVRVPPNLRKLAAEVQAIRETHPLCSLEDLAIRLGTDASRLTLALTACQAAQVRSLDQPLGLEEDGQLLDLLSDGCVPQIQDDHAWLRRGLTQLNGQARRVLALRYGGEQLRSLSQVAHCMGLTKSTVQALEQRALQQLRGSLHPRLRREMRCSLSA